MERLNHEVALLKMRTEQWRIHLRSVPSVKPRRAQSSVGASRNETEDQGAQAFRT
jgi:hypothetical protein